MSPEDIERVNEALKDVIPGLVITKNTDGSYTYAVQDEGLKVIGHHRVDSQLPWIQDMYAKALEVLKQKGKK